MTSVIRTDVLATADRSHVIAFLETIADKTPVYWLPGDHPAKLGQLPRQWPTVNAIPHQQRIEAIAISAPLHCVDGWSYASRAIASLLAGDGHAARHLAYYAQLRAGLSLLANLGVGIFNRINFVAKADGTTERLARIGTLGNL